MCGLYSLPRDLIRVSLQYIKLGDITRLILATNNHIHYEILTEVLYGMEYSSDSHYHEINSLYDWARKKGIRLTTIYVSSVISPSLNYYLELYGHWVTYLKIIESSPVDIQTFKLSENAAILAHIPNVNRLCIQIGTELTYTETTFFLQIFHVLPVNTLRILIIPPASSYYKLSLNSLLQTFPLLEKLESSINVDMSSVNTVYPQIKYINDLNSQHIQFFPNSERVTVNQVSGRLIVSTTAYNKINQLHYTINLHHGLEILQKLLNAISTLKELWLTKSIATVKSVTAITLNQCTNITLLHVNLSDQATMTIQLLCPYCPNLLAICVVDFHPSDVLSICCYTLNCCKNLRSLEIYIRRGYVINDPMVLTSKILDDCHEHKCFRELWIVWSAIIYLKFNPIDNMSSLKPLCERVNTLATQFSHFDQGVCTLLRKCPALTYVELSGDDTGNIDFQMLYELCPALTTVNYSNCYRLLQYSRTQLETIITKTINAADVSESVHTAHFPSLRSLSISGSIDYDSWNHMLSKCEFTIHRLTVRDSDSLEAIMDTLLHHMNFRELQYVFTEELDYNRLEELTVATGRRIQFHNISWL